MAAVVQADDRHRGGAGRGARRGRRFGISFLTGGWFAASCGSNPQPFVGSETCAGCHQAEAELWRSSQHKHAMDHATDKSVLGDFNDATLRLLRRALALLPQGRQVPGRDRRARTASSPPFEVKYTFGVDPLQQYLIEFPDGRLQALSIAWDSRPKDNGGQRWFHLYPERGDQARRRPALDQAEPELELHVRRVPLDRRAQELRRGQRPLRHHLGGDQRGLRGLPRPGLAARRLGARAAELVAVRQERRPANGAARPVRRAARRHLADRSGDGQRRRSFRRPRCARRSRPAACATRAAARFPRIGCPAGRCPTRTWSRRSRAGSTMPTGRCATRSTITARSSRARCSRPA